MHAIALLDQINLIKIRSFDPLPYTLTKGSNEIPVQSREYIANKKTAYALAKHCKMLDERSPDSFFVWGFIRSCDCESKNLILIRLRSILQESKPAPSSVVVQQIFASVYEYFFLSNIVINEISPNVSFRSYY